MVAGGDFDIEAAKKVLSELLEMLKTEIVPAAKAVVVAPEGQEGPQKSFLQTGSLMCLVYPRHKDGTTPRQMWHTDVDDYGYGRTTADSRGMTDISTITLLDSSGALAQGPTVVMYGTEVLREGRETEALGATVARRSLSRSFASLSRDLRSIKRRLSRDSCASAPGDALLPVQERTDGVGGGQQDGPAQLREHLLANKTVGSQLSAAATEVHGKFLFLWARLPAWGGPVE
jgi:hypothetical protein